MKIIAKLFRANMPSETLYASISMSQSNPTTKNKQKNLFLFGLVLFLRVIWTPCSFVVISCGWLAPPIDGKKEGTTYLQGATVRLLCDDGFVLQGSAERTCRADGTWSEGDTFCVVHSSGTSTLSMNFRP